MLRIQLQCGDTKDYNNENIFHQLGLLSKFDLLNIGCTIYNLDMQLCTFYKN
jgi:hypothetical protein